MKGFGFYIEIWTFDYQRKKGFFYNYIMEDFFVFYKLNFLA